MPIRTIAGFLIDKFSQICGKHEIWGQNAAGTASNNARVNDQGQLEVAAALTGRNAVITATIANGQYMSSPIDLGDKQLLAIVMPDVWDAANLTFQASTASDGIYKNVYDDSGLEVVVTAGTARVITVDANVLKLAGLQYIRIRSGTTATPVNQTADRTLTIIGKV